MSTQLEWQHLSDAELLKWRFCDLQLGLGQSEFLNSCLEHLDRDLNAKKIKFRPRFYLGDEWFSPEGMAAIAMPFYLAHPRLVQLEQNLMLEVEGGSTESCLGLLRHEMGHCLDHAFKFSRRPSWRKIFGSPKADYDPGTYRPRPYSKSFVRHLDNWYAQAHPDEDFAETVAVWLDPNSDWKKTYAAWPGALKKLLFVDQLMKGISGKSYADSDLSEPWSVGKSRKTLEKHYVQRRKERAEDYPDFFDDDLRQLFPDGTTKDEAAKHFLSQHRSQIIDAVSYWTGSKKYLVSIFLRKLSSRCDVLKLRVSGSREKNLMALSAYLSTTMTHHLFTGRFKRSA